MAIDSSEESRGNIKTRGGGDVLKGKCASGEETGLLGADADATELAREEY